MAEEKPVIRFSHVYEKMPPEVCNGTVKSSRLLEVFWARRSDLSGAFVEEDTQYLNADSTTGHYLLPDGDLLILLLRNGGTLWTTVRRWTAQKERWYRGLRGQCVKIEIVGRP